MLLQEYVNLTKQQYPPITKIQITKTVELLEEAYNKMPNHYLEQNYFLKRLNLSPYLVNALLVELINQNYMTVIYTIRCRNCQAVIMEGERNELALNTHCDWCYEELSKDNLIIDVSFRYIKPRH